MNLIFVCFLCSLSQGLAQLPTGMGLFEGLTQYTTVERTMVLEKRLDTWLQHYQDQPLQLAVTSVSLLNALEARGYFKAAAHLSERIQAQQDLLFDTHQQRKWAHYRHIQEGKPVPQLSLDPAHGIQINGPAKVADQKQLLFFWSSSCSHCTAALPKIAALQSQLAARGIQLLSISLDREEALFRETAGPYPWTHYCDLQGWDSPNVKAYRVFATPSFFLVNPDQILEREFISTAQIETWLSL